MFIYVAYKDGPELSHLRLRGSEEDLSLEKTLLVNPNCPVRIMLEYIRKKCRLGSFTQFDLCGESGGLLGLFNMPTYAYATDQFEHKKTYYIIVIKTEDLSFEKTLLVNPNCPVRIMLEYIRKKCRLGSFTQFDLCGESGGLLGLFNMPTYAYATDQFEHKKTYYIIVIKTEADKRLSVLPQLNHENRIYVDLKNRVKKFLTTGELSPQATPPGKVTPPPAAPAKPTLKKK